MASSRGVTTNFALLAVAFTALLRSVAVPGEGSRVEEPAAASGLL